MSKENNVIINFLSSLFLILICILIISQFIYLSFILIKFLSGLLFKNILVVYSLAILLTLIIFAIIPDNIIFKLSPLIERYAETNSCYYPKNYQKGSVTIFLFMLFKAMRFRVRLKIYIYAISFILVFITNIQVCGLEIIRNQHLKDIQVVINGAVLTFVVFDRFVNELRKLREEK